MSKSAMTEKYSAPALSKGLDILELLANRSKGMKKSEIAASLDRSVSEIFRMLVVLSDREYLFLDPDSERYALTPRLFEMAHRHPPVKRLSTVASEVMEELAHRVNQSIHLAILNGSEILVVAQTDPPGNNVTSVRLGARVPILLTASGAVLTYQLSEKRRKTLCSRLEMATPELLALFDENVRMCAANRFCESASRVISGVFNISVPIYSYSGEVIAALTIPHITRLVATNDPSRDESRIALIEAGKRISELLGAGASEILDEAT